ncbi:hypothetical protein [Corynebacterium durum]|uniref:hypothetical protein n=1 Tax=Corynebacterium durum TaxID=61592 RepID=UPI0028E3FAC6|nr:hypothetical protein [Corynebacterium durum]
MSTTAKMRSAYGVVFVASFAAFLIKVFIFSGKDNAPGNNSDWVQTLLVGVIVSVVVSALLGTLICRAAMRRDRLRAERKRGDS